jgi:hypothetical protein
LRSSDISAEFWTRKFSNSTQECWSFDCDFRSHIIFQRDATPSHPIPLIKCKCYTAITSIREGAEVCKETSVCE